MTSLPSRATPKGVPTPSVEHLTAHFDGISLGSPSQPQTNFVGGFKDFTDHRTARGGGVWQDKPLPVTPSGPSNAMRVASNPGIPTSLQPGYGRRVGGPQSAPSSPSPVGIVPRPPEMHLVSMPVPMPVPMPSLPSPYVGQSHTMTFATSAPPTLDRYTQIPQPDNGQTHSYFHHQRSSSVSTPPVTPSRTRASSVSSSPASTRDSASPSSTAQCCGTTKAGKRCTRVVKGPPPLSFFAPSSSQPVERFCFQHTKEILEQSGFYSHKQGAGWVKFADWIPDYLHPDTQAALRAEMEKPASKSDEPGYIYAYEIRDDRAPNELQIKVGRAVKLVKRLDQWSKQCTSKEVILRGWWPGRVEDEDGTNGTSLLRGKVVAGEKGPCCHRLERLVHLQLADLALHAPYLKPGFPKMTKPKDFKAKDTASPPSTPGRSPKPSKVRMPGGQPCRDCGTIHKEIFTFQRPRQGKYKEMEWESIVKPVIEHWGTFVGRYV